MADIAEECGFGAIKFRQGFETIAFFLGGPRILNGGRDLAGD